MSFVLRVERFKDEFVINSSAILIPGWRRIVEVHSWNLNPCAAKIQV